MNDVIRLQHKIEDLTFHNQNYLKLIEAKEKEIERLKLDITILETREAGYQTEIERLKKETFYRKDVSVLIDFANTQGHNGKVALIQFDKARKGSEK